jgi:acyl-CoA synthetase (AMP-forming)/AMP-acid ligase II
MEQRIARLAGGLRQQGFQCGDHVAILATNSPVYFEMMFAVWWLGGILVPINTRLAPEEIGYIVEHSQSRFFVVDEAMQVLAQRCEIPASVQRISLDSENLKNILMSEPITDASPEFESLAGIFYTGGTTGMPKGVELTHRNFAFAAMGMLRDLQCDEHSVYLHASPMFHLADFGTGMGVTLAAGGHSFLARFTPEDFYQRLRDECVTHVQLVPTMIASVLDAPCRDDDLLSRIRCISYGAAPISKALLERALKGFPNARIHQFYGMTEVCGASVMLGPQWHVLDGPRAGKLSSAGRVLPGFELRIADDQGHALAVGQVGEIQMKGPAVMRGYWRSPEQTQQVLVDGWLKSGDAAYLDEEGFVHIVDRLKDMIISGGENIYCSEVENALSQHPAVQASAVVGIPDEQWGEKVHAVVVLRQDAQVTFEALEKHCRKHIASYKVPRSYEFVAALPLSAVGKVQKKVLKELWMAKQGQNP